MSEASQFSRAAIMSWANRILNTDYTNFAEVPAKDVALLLYGIYDASQQTQKISLHDIQFTDNLTPTILLHNAQHVLQLLKTLSEAEAKELNGMDSAVPSANVYKMDPNLSAVDWLEGKAFVEELKMWRWVRMKAETLGVAPDAVRAAIHTYLHGTTTALSPRAKSADRNLETPLAQEPRGTDHKRTRDAAKEVEPNARDEDAPRQSKQRKKEDRISSMVCANIDNPNREVSTSAMKEERGTKPSDETVREFERESAVEETKSKDLYEKVVHTKKLLQELETQIAQTTSDENNETSGTENFNPLTSSLCVDLSLQKTAESAQQCKDCPLIFAHMVQSNLDLIKRLEEQRKAALNACTKKDVAALITALQNIV